MNLCVLLQAAFLIEPSPTYLAAVRFLTGVNPLMSLQVAGTLKIFTAVRTDVAFLKHQPLHCPPPHLVVRVAILTVPQQPAAERAVLKPGGAAAGRGQSRVQTRFGETRQGVLPYI